MTWQVVWRRNRNKLWNVVLKTYTTAQAAEEGRLAMVRQGYEAQVRAIPQQRVQIAQVGTP